MSGFWYGLMSARAIGAFSTTIRDQSAPSSSARIAGSVVEMPWPISAWDRKRGTRSSGAMRTQAVSIAGRGAAAFARGANGPSCSPITSAPAPRSRSRRSISANDMSYLWVSNPQPLMSWIFGIGDEYMTYDEVGYLPIWAGPLFMRNDRSLSRAQIRPCHRRLRAVRHRGRHLVLYVDD